MLLSSGYQCAIPSCRPTAAPELHRINGKHSDNNLCNLLALCAEHHRMAHQPHSRLDGKAFQLLADARSPKI